MCHVGKDIRDLDPVALEGEGEFFGLDPGRQGQSDDGDRDGTVAALRPGLRALRCCVVQQQRIQGWRAQPPDVADSVSLIDQSLEQGSPQHIVIGVQAMLPLGLDGSEGRMPRLPHTQGWGGYAAEHGYGSNFMQCSVFAVNFAHFSLN